MNNSIIKKANFQIEFENMASKIYKLIEENDISINELINSGIPKQQVYSVLRKGKSSETDYRISTLFRILDYINAKIAFISNKEKLNINIF